MILRVEVCGHPQPCRIGESVIDVAGNRRRDVSFGVEDSPHVNDVVADDVEHQIREAGYLPDTQVRNLQFIREPKTPRPRRSSDLADSTLDCVDKPKTDVRSCLAAVVIDGAVDVGRCALAQLDRAGGHVDQVLDRKPSRSDAK